MLHRHLERQLRKMKLSPQAVPASIETWQRLLAAVSISYDTADRERYLTEQSTKISSDEMRELNARLKRERDHFERILRIAPAGVALIDAQARIRDINQALERVLGCERTEAVGHSFLDFIPAEEREPSAQRIMAMSSGKTLEAKRRTFHLLRKDGQQLLVNSTIATLCDEQGVPSLVVAVVEDITERTRLELELRHAQKLESVGRLAAGIAHEINTPIQFVGDNTNFLSGAFEDLLRLCAVYRETLDRAALRPLSADDEQQVREAEERADIQYLREHIQTAIASTLDGVGRVSRIVQSMKAFAHPDSGERSSADINAALRNTLTVATNELKYVATVETDFGDIPLLPCFLGDLNQVFLNLLINAAHSIADVVGKSGQRGVIRVRTYQEDAHVVVAISDTGTGIPPGIQSKIFEPFFTTKEVGRGTGQGLALAHSVVVDQHGGTIRFDTSVGKGTTFFVRLPVSPPLSREEASKA